MPTSVKAVGTERRPGQMTWEAAANKYPTQAPTKSVGVKTPPTAPEPNVAEVATSLRTKMIATLYQM